MKKIQNWLVKNYTKIIIAVVSTLIVSFIGAIAGVKINDAVQDSKIDLIAKDVAWIKDYLLNYR